MQHVLKMQGCFPLCVRVWQCKYLKGYKQNLWLAEVGTAPTSYFSTCDKNTPTDV
jgi:hypothetical protein